MMKKALIFGLAFSLALSLTACGGSNDNTADNNQNSSTPEITQPMDSSFPETTQPVNSSAPEIMQPVDSSTPEAAPELEHTPQPTPEATPETTPAPTETISPQETGPQFTEVNEVVYATTSVNVRASYSSDSDKVGGLSYGASATRTGIGDNGWSQIIYGDSVAYVNSDYLTTTKPSSSNPSGSTSTSTSKPSSTSTSGSSTSGTTSKPSSTSNDTSNTSGSSGSTSYVGSGPINSAPSSNPFGNTGRPTEYHEGGSGYTGEEYKEIIGIISEEMAGSVN